MNNKIKTNNINNIDGWDLIIKPQRHLLDINLKEIWRYKDLILLFVRRDFVSKYKQSILGPLWFIIQPLLTTIMFVIVFAGIAKIPTDGLPGIIFYLAGIVPWTYFSTTMIATSDTFISNAGIFGKVYFPRIVTPISIVISNLIQFGIQFFFLIVCMLYYYLTGVNFHLSWFILLLPIILLLMASLGLGLGIIVSSMTTKYRDLRFLVQFGVQLLMYATPVIYSLQSIPEKYKIYILANPLTPLIEAFRFSLFGTGTFTPGLFLYSFISITIILLIGILMFNRVEKTFIDTV